MMYLVQFAVLDDNEKILDSIWSTWEGAQARVEHIEKFRDAWVMGADYEPLSLDCAGYEDDFLSGEG